MTNQEKQMFGMSTTDIREDYMDSFTARVSGQEMVVMGILSDAQHMLESEYDTDLVRKQLNIAKFILSEMMMSKRAA